MGVRWHTFKSRKRFVGIEQFKATIRDGVRTEICPMLVNEYAKTVTHWKTPPKFFCRVDVTEKGISLQAVARGKAGMIWRSLDKGVPGRTIYPRRKYSHSRVGMTKAGKPYKPRRAALRLMPRGVKTGRASYTHKASLGGGGGEKWIFRAKVEWPGIKARGYTADIHTRLKPRYKRTMTNIVRRATRRVWR